MQSSNRPAPREFDDRKRASAHYHEYDDVYQNRSQHSTARNVGRGMEVPVAQAGQHHQQLAATGQSKPPVSNNATLSRGAPNGSSRPPSYAGPPTEENLLNRTEASKQRRRGYRRGEDLGEDQPQPNGRSERSPPAGSVSLSNQSLPVVRDRSAPTSQSTPVSPASASPTKPDDFSDHPGHTIPRIESPSIMTSVLQPLDKKVQEYNAQMYEEQNEMAQLDAQMAILQERRREAEKRYIAAKSKHDDYRRQFQGVERALRGEPDMFSQLTLQDERPSTQHTLRPPQTPEEEHISGHDSRAESWDSFKKPKSANRSRLSRLFGSS